MIDRHLGKETQYKFTYDPGLLVRERRELNRQHLNIQEGDSLPFSGHDIWRCYEFSILDTHGIPQVYVLILTYLCNSPYIVESKSLKLYLNSFSMTRFARIEDVYSLMKMDLENLLSSEISIQILKPNQGVFTEKIDEVSWFDLDSVENLLGIGEITDYTENPELLQGVREEGNLYKYQVRSSSLRSNCKVTHQPDFGDIFIYIVSEYRIDFQSLLKYIISFRSENHFHEEICETIYMRLFSKFKPSNLIVQCQYTRRGGIDINPVRYYHQSDRNLLQSPFLKTTRQ